MLEKQGYGRSACDWQECMLPWHHERKEKSELLDNYRYQLKTRSKMMWQRVTKQTLMTQSCERKRNGKSSTITRHDTKSKLHLCPNCVDIFSDFLIFHGVSHNHVKIHQSSDFSDVLITQALRRPQNKRRRKKKRKNGSSFVAIATNKDHGQESNLRPSWLIGTTSKRTTTCPNLTRCATTTPPRLDT